MATVTNLWVRARRGRGFKNIAVRSQNKLPVLARARASRAGNTAGECARAGQGSDRELIDTCWSAAGSAGCTGLGSEAAAGVWFWFFLLVRDPVWSRAFHQYFLLIPGFIPGSARIYLHVLGVWNSCSEQMFLHIWTAAASPVLCDPVLNLGSSIFDEDSGRSIAASDADLFSGVEEGHREAHGTRTGINHSVAGAGLTGFWWGPVRVLLVPLVEMTGTESRTHSGLLPWIHLLARPYGGEQTTRWTPRVPSTPSWAPPHLWSPGNPPLPPPHWELHHSLNTWKHLNQNRSGFF